MTAYFVDFRFRPIPSTIIWPSTFVTLDRPFLTKHLKSMIQGELIKVGLLGLVEFEWLETLNMISLDELDYEDYVEVANVLVKELQDDNCDIIIALTHMREPNDIRLGTILLLIVYESYID